MGSILGNRRVRAYDFETRAYVGEYESIGKAIRKLFIRNYNITWGYIYRGQNHKKGVKSYKDGRRYHFELVKKSDENNHKNTINTSV